MSLNESLGKAIRDKRTLAMIIVVAILWRVAISFNDPTHTITLLESVISGSSLFIMGWALFAYIFFMSRELKGWVELNKIYHWIAVSLIAINVYVIVYYAMRWYRLAGLGGVEEALVPLDFLFRNIRFIVLVVFYCVVIWLAKYLRKLHGDYLLVSKGISKV